MRLRNGVLVVVLAVGMTCAVCSALSEYTERGSWPDSWPKELEPLRDSAKTIYHSFGVQGVAYVIPFDNRDQFEKAWPYILKLKSKGAPLILEKGPATYGPANVPAGVCILWPTEGRLKLDDGKWLEARAPWPESARLPSGELPEYVVPDHETWIPSPAKGAQAHGWRARVDVILVVDGRIVDLNRIELPAETPIIDRRFEK